MQFRLEEFPWRAIAGGIRRILPGLPDAEISEA